MENAKLQIEVNNRRNEKGMVYAAVGIRGGFITKDYILDGKDIFHGNYAFFNVLFNYYRLVEAATGIHYDVQRATSILSFGTEKKEFAGKLENVLDNLLNYEYDVETFEAAKQKTKEGFANQYKDGSFRAKLKAFEYSDLYKRYSLKRMIDDIQGISFEEFLACTKELLVLSNICVYISGDISVTELNELKFTVGKPNHRVAVAGYDYNPLLRNDAHITNIARQSYNLSIITIDFLNLNITNFVKALIAEIAAEQLCVHDADVWVDSLDTSILFSSDQIRGYKSRLLEMNEERFEIARKSLIAKYITLLKNAPEHFTIKAVNQMIVGVYIDQFLEYLGKCTYQMFEEVCGQADFKINEAQIVLRKGSR